jgi:hypothetical protein
VIGSDSAFSAREAKKNGIDIAWTAALARYEVEYDQTSADRPRAGWVTTPPADPISESKDRTVALCSDGMSSFTYACRIGIEAERATAQTAIQPIAT